MRDQNSHADEVPREASRDGRRYFRDSLGTTWAAAEVIAPESALPRRRRSTRCLVFETACLVRRLWHYPQNWRALSDAELEALSWNT